SYAGQQLREVSLVASAVAFCLVLGGCALSHPPQHASIVPASLPKTTTIPPAWTASPGAKEAVANSWLKTFNDPGLDAVVAEALTNNPDLRLAAAKVEAARQTVVIVGAQLKPQVGAVLSAAGTRDANNSTFSSEGAYFGASWEIDVWGRVRAERAAANASFEAAALDYAFARQSLAATTAKSWYLAVETRRLLELAEQDVQLYEELLRLAKIREAAGKVGSLDIYEASANLNEAQSQRRKMQALYSDARRNLETLIGRYPSGELEVDAAFVPTPPPVEAGLPGSLLERRPDLLAAEHQVLAAFRTLEASKLALLPSIKLTADGGRLNDRLLSLLSLNPTLFHTEIQMYVPIYEGGELRAEIKIASAQQEEALTAYGRAALNAFREVEIALTNEGSLGERLVYQRAANRDRSEAVRIGKIKYQAGAIDMLAVLQLQTAQIEGEMQIVQTVDSQLANRVNLHLALGGSFDATPAATPPNNSATSFRTP
ncbi:MAG: efflux transporter outer membrane subunit, partial [Bryobacteraceae bacterium]